MALSPEPVELTAILWIRTRQSPSSFGVLLRDVLRPYGAEIEAVTREPGEVPEL